MRKINHGFVVKRKQSEAILQEMFTRWLDSKGILYVVSLMGVNLGPRVGAIRKRMGCRPGVPDILILQPAGSYHGMAVELKVAGGHISDEQKEFARRLQANGYYAFIMQPVFDVLTGLKCACDEVEYYLSGNNKKL